MTQESEDELLYWGVRAKDTLKTVTSYVYVYHKIKKISLNDWIIYLLSHNHRKIEMNPTLGKIKNIVREHKYI